MRKWNGQIRAIACVVLVFTLSLLLPPSGETAERAKIAPETYTPEQINVPVGKSIVIESPIPITRVSLAAPEIADTVVVSPRQIYVTGKAVGTTNLTLWEASDRVFTIFDVVVSPDISQLKEKLQAILPEENIRVIAAHNSLTLSGSVSSTENLSQVLAIAEAFAPQRVINLLQVAGVHQIMLEVRVAEMARSVTKRLGFNFAYLTESGEIGLSLLNNLTSSDVITAGAAAALDLTISPAINAIFRFTTGEVDFTGFIDALKENGLVKILAEPTLVTLSGQEANFLAGGEFPIPVAQEEGAISIEFKTFGVGLSFAPLVLSNDKISIRVTPEVSELDFANAVTTSGFVVPALTTRRASTVIELDDGQSFAIAGLLNETVRENISRFPLLGDIPILGALFRSSTFQRSESELVIIVTPRLVRPLDLTKQTLPTDQFVEPNDFEFYLLGNLEGQGLSKTRGLDGEFGHIAP